MNERPIQVFEVGGLVVDADTVIPGPAYLAVANGRVQAVGPGAWTESLDHRDGATVHRMPRRIAIPGLINAHGHAAMTLFRGAGDDVPLQTWLQQKIFPLEQQLTADAVYWGTLLACWEMVTSGTTCFTDMYFFMEQSARAVAESGLRAALSPGLLGFTEEMQAEGLAESRRFARDWHGAAGGRIQVLLGPHAPYTCPPPFLHRVADLSAELGLGIQIHLSETRAEVTDSVAAHGRTPIEQMVDVGLFERPVLAAHCVHVTATDIQVLQQRDVRVAHNPQSNLKLGSGIAPLVELLAAGVTVALGTDGAASNNNLDLFEELRLAATLHKGRLEDATAVPAKDAFAMATERGARAVFRPPLDGTLRPGASADLVFLDADSPRFQPQYDLLSNVVYAASAADVCDVFIGEQFVVENRQPTTLDTERISFEVARIARAFQRG
ncbi:MAG: amidohydrolase [Alicyclobacillus sp.]|nr:amidohydrolase [Alicyclobacillus sp.]